MWYLTRAFTNQVDENPRYFFLKRETTAVGRKDKDIVLENDESISRNHAQLTLEGGKLMLEDTKSKYGTFLRRFGANSTATQQQAVVGTKYELNDGDMVTFGRFSSKFTVHRENFQSAISGLNELETKKLTTIFQKLGVQASKEVDRNSTHLTLPRQTIVSVKLSRALSLCIPVVTIEYWMKMLDAFESNRPFPQVEDFQPEIKEELNFSACSNPRALQPDLRRRKLFAGKTFIFSSSRQMQEFELIIESCGGESLTLSKQSKKFKDLVKPNSVFIQPYSETANMSQSNQTATQRIERALKERGLRMIPDMEITLAVMNVSLEKWCNTTFISLTNLLTGIPSQQSQSVQRVLVPSTSNFVSENLDSCSIAMDSYIDLPATEDDAPRSDNLDLESAPIHFNNRQVDRNVNIDIAATQHEHDPVDVIMQLTNESSNDKENESQNQNPSELTSTHDTNTTTNKKRLHEYDTDELPDLFQFQAAPKRVRNSNLTLSNDSQPNESALPPPSSRRLESTTARKRSVRNVTCADEDGELFNFGSLRSKRAKLATQQQTQTSDESQSQAESIVVVIGKTSTQRTAQKEASTRQKRLLSEDIRALYDENSNESNATWLNRKFNSITLNQSTSQDTTDSIPVVESVFKVIEKAEHFNITANQPSKGKTFVKKHRAPKRQVVITSSKVAVED